MFMIYRRANARPANPNKEPAAGVDNPNAPELEFEFEVGADAVALVHVWLDTFAEVSIVRSAHWEITGLSNGSRV